MADRELVWYRTISFSPNVYDGLLTLYQTLLQQRRGLILSQLDTELAPLPNSLWLNLPGGHKLFLGPNFTKQWVVSLQSTHAGTNALTQTGAVSWMRLPNITSNDCRTVARKHVFFKARGSCLKWFTYCAFLKEVLHQYNYKCQEQGDFTSQYQSCRVTSRSWSQFDTLTFTTLADNVVQSDI